MFLETVLKQFKEESTNVIIKTSGTYTSFEGDQRQRVLGNHYPLAWLYGLRGLWHMYPVVGVEIKPTLEGMNWVLTIDSPADEPHLTRLQGDSNVVITRL